MHPSLVAINIRRLFHMVFHNSDLNVHQMIGNVRSTYETKESFRCQTKKIEEKNQCKSNIRFGNNIDFD